MTVIRQAMIMDFADGHREYSPDVEIEHEGNGAVTLRPIQPFRRVPTGEPHEH